MSDLSSQAAAVVSVSDVAAALGVKLSPAELQLAGDLLVGLIQVIGGAAQKHATAAGLAAAATITTADEAERSESERT